MHAVILTFPGHFFQTHLCVKSLLEYYPEVAKLTFVLDDVQASPWYNYRDDFRDTWQGAIDNPWQIICCSEVPKIGACVAGWWRQQLVKLTLDRILPDDQWFVVDGDVIFRSRCEVQGRVPISRRYDADSRWNKMCEQYVKGLLGTDQGIMLDQAQPVITSAIPFRFLDRVLLSQLRQHVESRFGGDFVDLHLRWFADQTIVAYIDPPTRWVMSEWEVIECFRQRIQGKILPYQDLGSGYRIEHIAQVKPGPGIFIHSYKRDTDIGRAWFEDQGLAIPDRIWQSSLDWHHVREVQRLI